MAVMKWSRADLDNAWPEDVEAVVALLNEQPGIFGLSKADD